MSTNYQSVRAEAQKQANGTGFDYGIVKGECPPHYYMFMLPCRENRQGYELRCEVVSCEDLSKCKPGHGPCA
jgi:hypothetical protein